MAFDFEALVGHLYIVGGRSINASPPGLLVEVAPRKAARGREMDTFFTLVLPSGQGPAQASFYEQMSRRAAEEYFSSGGSVTSGIRSVYTDLNQNLHKHNQTADHAYEANMICAILHANDVFLAQVGGEVAILRAREAIDYFPASFDDDEKLFGPPLGIQPVADIKMSHVRLASGARLILADGALADLDRTTLEKNIAEDNLGSLLLGFKDQAISNLTLLAVEFVPPGTPDNVAVISAQSTRAEPVPKPAAPETPAQPQAKRPSVISYQVQKSASAVALKVADGVDTLNHIVEKVSEESSARPGRLSKLMSSSSIVLLPIALVIMVLVLWLSGTSESEFDLCLEDANKAADLARSIASNDVTGTLAAWNAVLLTTERCNEIRPNDPELLTLTREGQDIIDQLNDIDRREVVPVEAFPNASLSSIVLRGEDIYVLDDNNQQVYRVTVGEDGLTEVPGSRQAIATMRRGAAVGPYTLANIIDITWSEDGSELSQGNVLLALDRAGVLVEYSPTFLARGVQQLIGSEQWKTPVKFTTWRGRLYILDPEADQIWRYDPSGGTFPGAPLEYFTGSRRPTLQNAVDFAIDDTGRVFVLFSDGIIAMFRSGDEQAFGWAGFPANQSITSAYAMNLNNDPISNSLYLIDRSSRTLFQTSLAGTYFASYRAYDESRFELLSDVVVDENKQIVYVTSGNSILGFSK